MRRLPLILLILSLATAFLLELCPVLSTFTRVAFVASLGTAIGSFMVIKWRSKFQRYATCVVPFLPFLPFLLPGRELDRQVLRDYYVKRLQAYVSTRYVWGGENRRGIDCSGLPRAALRDALTKYGSTRLDGGALRDAALQWWFDASALALSEGYRGYTVPVPTSGTIRRMDYSLLQSGDLAVTQGGVHVLVFLGGVRWIEADPGLGMVVVLDGRAGANHWLDVPVTVHRWAELSGR